MAKFMVKASEFKNVCKAVNDRKLAELKKEIIEILKKQDEKDVKKAIDYFNSQEEHYTHLEKSLISGKWIQKAGYGVGTVRIWKGKKYKKIAPGKWARVFDKEGRGTNIAIGKLIAKVQKIDNIEDLMNFVMQNKQRFVDENGIDLPVLDKLRAAVDAKNNGDMGSKGISKPAESKKESAEDLEAALKEVEDAIDNAGDYDDIEELEKERKQLLKKLGKKPAEKENPVRLKHVVSPIEFTDNHGNKIRYEIDEVKNAPEDYQNPVRVYKVEGNVRTEIAGNVKNYEDAYSAVMEQVEKTKEGTTETEKKYIDESIKTLPKEDSKGNKIEESVKTQEDYEKEYEQSLKGKNDAETLDNIVEAYDKVAKKLRPEAKAKGMNPNELNDPELEALGKLRLIYSEKNISEGEKKYREELEKLSGRMKDAINNEFGYEEESEADKLEKEPEKKNEHKTVKIPSVNLGVTADGKDIKITKSTDAKKKIGIAKATLEDDKFIVPATKELDDTVKTMEKFFKDVDANNRIMLKGFGIVDGFLCATDGRQAVRIKIDGLDNSVGDCVKIRKEGNNYIIEQDDLSTTWEETTDDWSRGYKQMKKVTRTADRKTQKYPNVSRVIPDDATETMNLDTAALKDVIKQLKKEKFLSASTVRSDANHYLPVVIKDGNLTIDGKVVGTIPDKEIEKETAWDFRFIENALGMGANSFNYSPEKMKESTAWPLVASTNIGDTVFMSAQPMAKMTSYDKDSDKVVEIDKLTQHREEMARQKEKDESKRNAMYSTNKDYVDVTIESVKRSIKPDFSEKMIEKIKNMGVKDLKNLYNQAKVDIDDLMGKKDFYANTFSSYTNKHYDVSPKVLIAQNYALKQYPELVTEIEKQLEAKGEKVKKSLFDDFIVDMFVEEDEEEPEEENESLFNDYSAEQPELFNSTEMKVQEAFNRCGCL